MSETQITCGLCLKNYGIKDSAFCPHAKQPPEPVDIGEPHEFVPWEVNCSGTASDDSHPYCEVCGYCLHEGCSAFDWYAHTDKPVNKRAGHPRFHQIIGELQDLHDKKNSDYAEGMSEGPLGNFTRVAQIKSLYPGMSWSDPFGVAMGYMLKQLDAAFTLRNTNKKSLTGEPIPARLRDVAVYSIIGSIIYEEEEVS